MITDYTTHPSTDSSKMHIRGNCRMCGEQRSVTVTRSGLYAYRHGALMQDAFPHLSDDAREFLISGTCGPCFDAMWADYPDDGQDR